MDPTMQLRPTAEELKQAYHIVERERFWAKVNFKGPVHPVLKTKCWIWSGARQKSGHGVFRLGQQKVPAGKAALILTGSVVPDDLHVCHHCDIPACVRPEHLFLGTDRDNYMDMYSKKRHVHGASHPAALLTDESVKKILEDYLAGASVKALAKKNKIEVSTISAIVCGKTWKHITSGISLSRGRAKGEQVSSAKLNGKLVRELREKYRSKRLNVSKTARDLNITRAALRSALTGESWANIK